MTAPACRATAPSSPDRPPADDARLLAAVLEGLRSSGYLPLRALRCEVSGGVITLSGRVPTFHLKQVAQAAVRRAAPARQVRLLVEVR